MALIETVNLIPATGRRFDDDFEDTSDVNHIDVSWTGTAGLLAYIFVDGLEIPDSPFDFGATTARTQSIPFDEGVAHTVKIIEELPNIEVISIDYLIESRPTIYWFPIANANYYRIYKTEVGGIEEIVHIEGQQNSKTFYLWQPNVLFGFDTSDEGKWHLFRIEAVLEDLNVQSVTNIFPLFLYGYRDPPSDIEITGGSGNFTISVTK